MKREDLPKVLRSVFIESSNARLETRDGRYVDKYVLADLYSEWDALKVLNLPNIKAENKLYAVLDERFLPEKFLYEFACRCAEYALSLVENPDARSVELIRVKRRWMTGEVTDDELMAAWFAAREASLEATPQSAERFAAWSATWSAAWWSAAWSAAWSAEWTAEWAAAAANETAAYEHEVEILRNLINEWEG